MRWQGARRPALGFAVCTAALLISACFGQPSTQPAPTTGPPTPSTAASPSLASPSPLASPGASPSPALGPGEQRYTVEVGDTLGTIAQKFYGDPTQWRRIYDANRSAVGENPDAIRVGTELRIPPRE
jgi:nucleoid-associated protein YgaU